MAEVHDEAGKLVMLARVIGPDRILTHLMSPLEHA